MESLLSRQIRLLPKIDLHRHMDCSMRWSTLVELSREMGIAFDESPSKMESNFLIIHPMKDLNSVLLKFTNAQKVLVSEKIVERLALEACEDAFNDGVRILELRYAPTHMVAGHQLLTFEKVHQAILRGIEQAQKRWPMVVGLICTIERHLGAAVAEHVCDFAIENKDSFLAIDLANDESGYAPELFEKPFLRARKSGLHITVHAGEVPEDQSPDRVRKSIELLGAERIGHGIQIIRSPAVMEFVVNQKVALEVCPLSNYLTNSFADHASHPFRKLMESGVKVTINSDDPGAFASTLSDDYEILNKYHHFSLAEFKKLNKISYESSFLREELKKPVWELMYS